MTAVTPRGDGVGDALDLRWFGKGRNKDINAVGGDDPDFGRLVEEWKRERGMRGDHHLDRKTLEAIRDGRWEDIDDDAYGDGKKFKGRRGEDSDAKRRR